MIEMKKIEELTTELLRAIGEDPDREGLSQTPLRVAKAWHFFTEGYREDAGKIIRSALFNETVDEMVFVRDIDFYSLCEHHLMPFCGKCHIAYLPNGKIVGLSKLARVVDAVSRKLQIQERLTQEIADVIYQNINPQGVAVVVEGLHTCMAMRGVMKQNSCVTTSSMLGVFRENTPTRREFLALLGNRSLTEL